MKFTKMQGCGNDYVYMDTFSEPVKDRSTMAQLLSNRNFGIGSDGLIFINPSDKADFEMDMYNADGSRGAMCGNGIRCVAKYVYDNGLTDKTRITVSTGSGIKTLDLSVEDGKVKTVRVNMGSPVLEAEKIPVISDTSRVISQPITVAGKDFFYTAVSMGNPHAVVFLDDVENLKIEEIGPEFEHHRNFPDRVNTEFIKILDDHTIQMRVWERGSGETLACGTGACAAAAASILNHKVSSRKVAVLLRGGELQMEWAGEGQPVYLTGPAVTVFTGEIFCGCDGQTEAGLQA